MPVMPTVSPLVRMAEVAADPDAYALAWKQAHPGGKVAGVLPMNFPEELLHAAGFLPVVIQENSEPDSEGRVVLAEFYCGYTRNLADQAMVIAHSARERTESRGAHAREDYHERDDKNWLKHTVAWKDEDWKVTCAYRPVHLHALSNEGPSFPPAERTH